MAIVQRDIIVKNDKHFPKRHLDFKRDSLKKASKIRMAISAFEDYHI